MLLAKGLDWLVSAIAASMRAAAASAGTTVVGHQGPTEDFGQVELGRGNSEEGSSCAFDAAWEFEDEVRSASEV